MRRIECEKRLEESQLSKCSLCCQLITTLRSVVVLIVEDAATSERRWSELWARVQSLRALCNERVIGDDSVASSRNRHVIKPSPTDRLIGRSAAAAEELCLMIGRLDVGRPHWLAHQWLSDWSPVVATDRPAAAFLPDQSTFWKSLFHQYDISDSKTNGK